MGFGGSGHLQMRVVMLMKGASMSKVTDEYIIDAVRRYHRTLDNPGLCLACGHECEGVVSDAREHTCEVCGEPRVFGAEALRLMDGR